ncbi:MAG: hypothetical protein IPG04_34970 [Polyangiaceae bacterium]|nr:hypothetical protein [Polyangiaceae bacterium]
MFRKPRRRAGGAVSCLASVAALLHTGCLDRPIEPIEPRTTKGAIETLKSSRVDKIDLLLAIDNSISMADKQTLLGEAVPQLVDRLVNPRCVDPSKTAPVAPETIAQPAGPLDPCPLIDKAGEPLQTKREFEPVKDIHVGIISSSLGDLSGGDCGGAQHYDDGGKLLDRSLGGGTVPTFGDDHFLLWDPDGKYGPNTDVSAFQGTLTEMVIGVGQTGCGYEMQLESVVRFLVDPAPYAELVREPVEGSADRNVKRGVDEDVLTQRAAFLRPDSLVAIVMLSDENDCSVQAEGYGYFAFSGGLEPGSSACASSPDDPCCYSCNTDPPQGCTADPACAGNPEIPVDAPGLRCWDQKRRFGTSLLYPVSRYVNALTLENIDPARVDLKPKEGGESVPNPLLEGRPNGLVYFAGIVGVPWQAVARRNDAGEPDLARGYMTPGELESLGLFEALAGDPDRLVPPSDPFMIESVEPRSGTSAILGLAPTSDNAINGGDRTPADPDTELYDVGLQYACIFDVDDDPEGSECSECADGVCDNPVCEGTVQTHAKAVPGLRQLALIRAMKDQGIAASVCPANTDDAQKTSPEYGYNPAVGALVDALKDDLAGQECLPFSIEAIAGQVTCLVVQSSRADSCTCDGPGLSSPPATHDNVLAFIQSSEGYDDAETCFCEVAQLEADELQACQNDEQVPVGIDGWCYIDASPTSPVGNPDLVGCGETEPRVVRVVGEPKPKSGATLHIFCTGEGS